MLPNATNDLEIFPPFSLQSGTALSFQVVNSFSTGPDATVPTWNNGRDVDCYLSLQYYCNTDWRHGGAVASTVASQQEGSGFEPIGRLGPFCVPASCLMPAGDSKSPDRCECECEWSSVSIWLAIGDLSRVYPATRPNASWEWLQHPCNPVKDKRYK